MLIKYTKGNKTIDISLPFKKCNDLLEIIQQFMDVNSDVVDNWYVQSLCEGEYEKEGGACTYYTLFI